MLTQEYLKEFFNYNPETGEFSRIKAVGKQGKGCRVGDKIGTIATNGYVRIKIDGKYYVRSHLAWLYVYGYMPLDTIDHIDRIRDNDRILNLRSIKNRDNYTNMSKFNTNKSGHTGVCWHKKANKWCAQIVVNYKAKHLGLFSKLEDAIQARKEANIIYDFAEDHGKSLNNYQKVY